MSKKSKEKDRQTAKGAGKKTAKTNAMRILERNGVDYESAAYDYDVSDLSGVHAAAVMGLPAEEIFKTLVTRASGGSDKGRSGPREGDILVFVIPVAKSLDLKKAARVSGRKKIEMVHVREIEDLTGYIRGGCSPLGMKKQFPTFVDQSAGAFDNIYVSAGRRGLQIRVNPGALLALTEGAYAELTAD